MGEFCGYAQLTRKSFARINFYVNVDLRERTAKKTVLKIVFKIVVLLFLHLLYYSAIHFISSGAAN